MMMSKLTRAYGTFSRKKKSKNMTCSILDLLVSNLLIKYKLLREVSTNAPVRMKRLCTFTTTTAQKKRIKQAERERKISQRFLKWQVAWAAENKILPTNSMLGPFLVTPEH